MRVWYEPHLASLALAIGALITGMTAAWYWWRSSKVEIAPVWKTEPAEPLLSQGGWVAGIMGAVQKSANLNKLATIWTAVSVVLGSLSSIVGALT